MDEGHPPQAITVGNFPRNPDPAQWVSIPAGKSTIEILPRPRQYQTLSQWIEATEHGSIIDVPEGMKHVETKETFANPVFGKIEARCFTSPTRAKERGDRACMFQVKGKAIMVEATYTRDAQNVAEVMALVKQLIESARDDTK